MTSREESINKHMLVLRQFFSVRGEMVDRRKLRLALSRHADYPQLSAIVDSIKELGLECQAGRVPAQQLVNIGQPFFAISLQRGLVLVEEINDLTATCFTGNGERIVDDRAQFDLNWNGIILLVEAAMERSRWGRMWQTATTFAQQQSLKLILVLLGLGFFGAIAFHLPAISLKLGLLLSLVGLAISAFIFYLQSDAAGQAKYCKAEEEGGCNNVLESAYSRIGSWEWSEIGFSFFLGQTLLLIAAAFWANLVLLSVWAIAAVLASTFIPYSLFIQRVKLRQWCRYCLLTLITTASLAVTAAVYLSTSPLLISLPAMLFVGIAFLSAAIIGKSVKRIWTQQLAMHREADAYYRLVNNSQVFWAIHRQQPILSGNNSLPSIRLYEYPGESDHSITLVLSPHCPRCAQKFEQAIRLIGSGQFGCHLDVVVTPGKYPLASQVISSFCLAIADMTKKREALSFWFSTQDVSAFQQAFVLVDPMPKGGAYLNQVAQWMTMNQVSQVPVTLLDGVLVSEYYEMDQLGKQCMAA